MQNAKCKMQNPIQMLFLCDVHLRSTGCNPQWF
jgi:hypothetical protein